MQPKRRSNIVVFPFLLLITAFLLVQPFLQASAQTFDLTVDVLVNSSNTTGYNTSPSNPGEYQRYPERYLEHLQVPYRVIDVSTTPPPSNLSSVQLIIAGHKGLNLNSAWQQAIASAVADGTGFVNLDSDPNIGSNYHIQQIFSATSSQTGTAATQITIPSAVMPDGATPHYIAALQLRFAATPPGDLVYSFHQTDNYVTNSATATVLNGAKGTVLAYLGSDPLVTAIQTPGGRAVNFGTYDYLKADRFGFMMGLDDLFWRSLVWAARKPFVLRGYPHLMADQMDDEISGWTDRLPHLWDPSLTGTTNSDGTGGPWKVNANVQIGEIYAGGTERAAMLNLFQSGYLKVVIHTVTGGQGGDYYWPGTSAVPLTDSQWLTNLNSGLQWFQGNGGSDTIPSQYLSKSLVPHFWDLSDNTGYDLWHSLGIRYLTTIQKPNSYYLASPAKTDADRLALRPFRIYELPPTYGNPAETWPIYYADDITVHSRAGQPSQTFFSFCTQLLGYTYPRFDADWPNDGAGITVANSVDNWSAYVWRFWSGMAPVQIYNHDGGSFANGTDTEEQQAVQGISAFLNKHAVRHVFMDDMGAYMRARTKSVLASASATSTTLTMNFTGSATDADGNTVPTYTYLFTGDNEGTLLQVPGFTNGYTWTGAQSTPPRILALPETLSFLSLPNGAQQTQSLTVKNNGGGTLTYTAQTNQFWLTATVASGTAPDTITVTVNPAGLAVGTYTGTITLTSAGASNNPVAIPVTLTVQYPIVSVTPAQISMSGQVNGTVASQSIAISNAGSGTLHWTASSDASWLQPSSTSGTGAASVSLIPTVTGLTAGSYTAHVTVANADDATNSVVVTVNLNLSGSLLPTGPVSLDGWAYSPLGLAANWSVSNNSIVYNGGGHTQLYTGNSEWSNYTFQASIKLSSLSNYPGGIRAYISPAGASYAAWIYPNDRYIRLFRTTTWNIDSNASLLATSSTISVDTTSAHTLAIQVSNGVVTVLYDGTQVISVNDSTLTGGMVGLDVSNQPISFSNFSVASSQAQPAVTMQVTPTSLNLTAAAGSKGTTGQQITTSMSDNSAAAVSVLPSVSWLTGTSQTGMSSLTSSFIVDATSLTAGTYTANLHVVSRGASNGDMTIPVNVTVTAAPSVQATASPTSLSFSGYAGGSSPAAQAISLSSNPSGASFSATADSSWISVSPSTGSTNASLSVTVTPASLAAGTYNGNVTITVAGASGAITVPVTLVVSSTSLTATPQTLSFVGSPTLNPLQQAVALNTSNGASTTWTTSLASSLFTASASGTTPSSLLVGASSTGQSLGTYSGQLTITPGSSGISALQIPLSLRVGTLLFSDNFQNGSGNWTASPMGLASGWTVTNGTYQYNGGGATQQYAGNSTWTNYTLQMQYTLANAQNYPGGIRFRVNPSTGAGYALWFYPGSGVVKLLSTGQWNIDYGFSTLAQASGVSLSAGVHSIRVDANGATLTIFVDNVQLFSVNDTTYSSGLIALDVSNQPVAYSNISVISF